MLEAQDKGDRLGRRLALCRHFWSFCCVLDEAGKIILEQKVATTPEAMKYVRLIGESRRKDDRMDARTLARLARIDPQPLSPVQHRSAKAQIHFDSDSCAGRTGALIVLVTARIGDVVRPRLRKCGVPQVKRGWPPNRAWSCERS